MYVPARKTQTRMEAVTTKFLTYGSACQDCGFNNQRTDLENAARLALSSGRTLVVRNFACSVHSPCPKGNGSTDGFIYAMGGVSQWHATCEINECDFGRKKRDDGTRWGAGVRYLPPYIFVDPAYFRDMGVPFIWQDDFHARYPKLLENKSAWVNLLRRDERRLTAAEKFAPVWHVTHLHKAGMFGKFAKDIIPSARWPKVPAMRYAPWLQRVAQSMIADLRAKHGVHDFTCVHARLGDWIVHSGYKDEDFRPIDYARGLHQLHRDYKVANMSMSSRNSKRVIYVATARKSLARLTPALSTFFKVESSSSLDMAKKIAETEPNPNEDVFSCIEQLICIRAQIFVGTPGSTVSNFVRHARVPLIHREPGRQTLSLSPVGFVKKSKSTKALSGQERLDHVARYWKQERQAGRAEKLPVEKRSLSSQSEGEASGHSRKKRSGRHRHDARVARTVRREGE